MTLIIQKYFIEILKGSVIQFSTKILYHMNANSSNKNINEEAYLSKRTRLYSGRYLYIYISTVISIRIPFNCSIQFDGPEWTKLNCDIYSISAAKSLPVTGSLWVSWELSCEIQIKHNISFWKSLFKVTSCPADGCYTYSRSQWPNHLLASGHTHKSMQGYC